MLQAEGWAVSTLLEILPPQGAGAGDGSVLATVSTLLEILQKTKNGMGPAEGPGAFQPFLRFYPVEIRIVTAPTCNLFQPFLRFYPVVNPDGFDSWQRTFQPFLRFYAG